jgi:3-phenylpropionate/cinnamic acid dioxygenase small subunit
MEIDRGTKGLEDTFRQVQKYVLAGMTIQLRRPPLTLWVIADSRGNHRQRVQRTVEEAEKAFSLYPGSRTVLAIADIESVNGTKSKEIINKEIWRLLSSSNPVGHAVSLASIFEE